MKAQAVHNKFQNAKPGDLFYTTLTNRDAIPKVLIFEGVKGKKATFKVAVPSNPDDLHFTVPASDPEGAVPKLTEAVLETLHNRITEIQQELVRYLAVPSQLFQYQKNHKFLEWIANEPSELNSIRSFLNAAMNGEEPVEETRGSGGSRSHQGNNCRVH